jgi:hypothetical protein
MTRIKPQIFQLINFFFFFLKAQFIIQVLQPHHTCEIYIFDLVTQKSLTYQHFCASQVIHIC